MRTHEAGTQPLPLGVRQAVFAQPLFPRRFWFRVRLDAAPGQQAVLDILRFGYARPEHVRRAYRLAKLA